MWLFDSHRKAFARFALVAMLCNASWPLVANAQPQYERFDALFSTICTAQGIKAVSVSQAPASPHDALHHLPHCAFCSLSPVHLAPPSVAATAAIPTEIHTLALPKFPAARLLARLFLQALSRAPPVFSS